MTHDGTVKIWAQTFTMTTAWQRYTFTVPGHADLTFNNDTGNGLRVFFIPYYGTTYTASGATLGQWNTYSSGNYMTDMSNQVAASSTYTDITGVQIEVATAATPFEHRLYQDDLRDCQRYYFEYGVESQPVTNSINNNAARLPMSEYPVKMRATPTLTTTNTLTEFSSGSTHTVSAFYNQAANGAGYIQLGGNTTNGVYMKFKANAEL